MFKLILICTIVIVYFYIVRKCKNLEKFTFDSGIPGPRFLAIATIHGNEPAGSWALESIVRDFKSQKLKLKKGSLVVVPCLNPCGRILRTRYQPHELLKMNFEIADGNRTYPKRLEESANSDVTKEVIQLVNKSDAVFDGHEAYSYVRLNTASMGNGIFAGTTLLSMKIAKNIEEVLNKKIPNTIPYKRYKAINFWRTPDGSLRNYCNRKKKHYILMETAGGQNNIEPPRVRTLAQKIVCLEFMRNLGMI